MHRVRKPVTLTLNPNIIKTYRQYFPHENLSQTVERMLEKEVGIAALAVAHYVQMNTPLSRLNAEIQHGDDSKTPDMTKGKQAVVHKPKVRKA